MCGIYACLARDGLIESGRVHAAISSLNHRGPDSQRYWIAPERNIALGCARLVIVDLRGGDQPISSESGDIRIVVNGEFYDFERIRSELEFRGHHFLTRSDSEILLHLYREFGTNCISWLRGEFAFVLWDEANHTIFAARADSGSNRFFTHAIKARLAWHLGQGALRRRAAGKLGRRLLLPSALSF
jgi:asparagine synthase (glutamine-hydrolysing)